MPMGLGFANPELQKAQLLASLNGSTSIPKNVMAVGKVAESAPAQVPQPAVQQKLPTQAMTTIQPEARSNLTSADATNSSSTAQTTAAKKGPDFYETAGALGHIILSIDAGLRNQPMPDPPGGDPRAAQDQEMQVQEFVMNTAARAWEAMRKAPIEQRSAMMQQFEEVIRRVTPDFDLRQFIEGLMDDEDWVDQIAPEVAMMSEEAKSMFMARVRASGQDLAESASSLLKDREFMDGLRGFDDNRNAPVLKYKLQRVRAAMVSMQMDENTFAGMSFEDFQRVNDQLPESVRLTPSEIATMRRRPDLGAIIGLSGSEQATGGIDRGGPPTLDRAATYSPPKSPATNAIKSSEAPGQGQGPPRPQPSPRASAPQPRTAPQKPQTPSAPRPNYPPGWNPDMVTKVEVVGRRPRKETTASPQRERRVVVPRDMDIPGYGRARKGDALIYNYETGEYRRSS